MWSSGDYYWEELSQTKVSFQISPKIKISQSSLRYSFAKQTYTTPEN